MDCSPPGCSVHGILQVSILEWVAISFSYEAFKLNSIQQTLTDYPDAQNPPDWAGEKSSLTGLEPATSGSFLPWVSACLSVQSDFQSAAHVKCEALLGPNLIWVL